MKNKGKVDMGYVHTMEYAESYLTCRYYPNRGETLNMHCHISLPRDRRILENPAEKETR